MSGSNRLPAVAAAICSTIWLGGCIPTTSPPEATREVQRERSVIPSPLPSTNLSPIPSPIPSTDLSPIPSPIPSTDLSPIPSPATESPVVTSTPTPIQPGTERSLNLYWLKDNGTKLELVPSPAKVSAGAPSSVLKGLFSALFNGSNNSNLATAIPQGTKLRSIEVKQDGIHVNLSQEFTSGGGSASMSGRLGQVVYTATALDPKTSVWINVEGKKLEVLGGEGLEIEQPLTRQKFREDFDF